MRKECCLKYQIPISAYTCLQYLYVLCLRSARAQYKIPKSVDYQLSVTYVLLVQLRKMHDPCLCNRNKTSKKVNEAYYKKILYLM